MKKHFFLLGALASLVPSIFFASDALSNSINSLSSRFYQEEIASSDKNEIFSPYCLFNCLSMVYVGAGGDTEKEISQVLDLNLSQEDLPLSLKNFSNSLLPSDGLFQLNSASSMWTNQNAFILPSYFNSIQGDLGASVASLDFSDTIQSAATINDWIKEQAKRHFKIHAAHACKRPLFQRFLAETFFCQVHKTRAFLQKCVRHKTRLYDEPKRNLLVL